MHACIHTYIHTYVYYIYEFIRDINVNDTDLITVNCDITFSRLLQDDDEDELAGIKFKNKNLQTQSSYS